MGFTPEQIKGRIKSVAKQNNADARTLMRIYMMERFLERLAQSEYRDNFIIKGGILVTAMIGVAHRSTMDIENVIMMVPFTSMVIWTFQEKVGSSWKKILWYSGKIAFIFSISIEMLQLFLRLGTFQLSDLFYNTVGGVVGGLVYYGIVKARKHL